MKILIAACDQSGLLQCKDHKDKQAPAKNTAITQRWANRFSLSCIL
jgi:hypothetical protein